MSETEPQWHTQVERHVFHAWSLRNKRFYNSFKDPQQCWSHLEDKLKFLNLEELSARNWYIDVGLEVYIPGHVVQWLEDTHLWLLHFGLPLRSENNSDSLTTLLNNKKNFRRDLVAQLKEFAGFCSTPGTRGISDSIAYLNVYTTNKEPIYQLHKGIFWKHLASELLPSAGENKLLKDVTEMSSIYGQCMGLEGRTLNEGCACFEVQIKLLESVDALTTMSNQLLRDSLVAIPVDLWW